MECFDSIQKSALSAEQKAVFGQRKLQYLQEFGESLVKYVRTYVCTDVY